MTQFVAKHPIYPPSVSKAVSRLHTLGEVWKYKTIQKVDVIVHLVYFK